MKKQFQTELALLRSEQRKARQNEVFGGLSKTEQAEFNSRAERIRALESAIEASAGSAEVTHRWNKDAETDIPRSEDRQPYRSRETDSIKAFTSSRPKQ
ncbi:MAG: hypothetical protein JWQ87_5208 [Candidatus Sulfotelmatobacter sp.]|nr:hypothetical protein [Candidatus Sulfotelmatobacter sp.]